MAFQSTLPRGERRLVSLQATGQVYFNPRSHEGSDKDDQTDHTRRGFQSTLPRGERLITSSKTAMNV